MAEGVSQSTTTNVSNEEEEENKGKNSFAVLFMFINLVLEEQNNDPSTSLNEPTMMDTSAKEQQLNNVVDDATLQAVLSTMTEPEMHAFLEELNKTGKACE